MINAQLPDGTTLQFPDGTPDAVVDGTVKQHVQSLPGGQVETPESKMGFSPAPPEEKSAVPDLSGGFISPSGDYVPAAAIPGVAPSNKPAAVAPDVQAATPRPPPLDMPRGIIDPTARPAPGALGRIGAAAAEGWRGAPAISMAPVNSPAGILNPINTAANALLGASGALFRGGQQFVQESLDPMSPGLGREVAAIPEAFPFGVRNELMRPPDVAPPYAQPSMADRLENAIVRADDQPPRPPRPPETPPEPSPAPGAPPQPASVGAAASRENTPSHMLTLTPDEEQAYRSTAEGNKLIETQQPGVTDDRQLVTGVQPNTAEIEQTVQAARELKNLKLQSPPLSGDMAAITDANNTARQAHFDNIAGSPVQLTNAIAARSAQAESDLNNVWANKTDTSPQPVLDTAQQILQGEDGRRPLVRDRVNSVVRELYDDNGELITDPQLLYGVRKHIDDMLSSEAGATDPLAKRAQANLQQLKGSLDGVIQQGAQGFPDYLANFSNASRPIDAMRVLQDARNSLVGTQNRMEYGRFQRFMRDVVDSRQEGGINPYQSITPDQMQQLWNLRDDLRRSSAAVELARTAGSDSAQNLWDMAKSGLARGVGAAIGGTVGHAIGGPIVGSVGASVGANVAERSVMGRMERKAYQRGQEMLNPPTTRNTLMPP